jgi:hypothetical protein
MATRLLCVTCGAPTLEIVGGIVEGATNCVEAIGYALVCEECGHREISAVLLWMLSEEAIERP